MRSTVIAEVLPCVYISVLVREASDPPMGMGVTGGLASDGEGVEDVLTPNI